MARISNGQERLLAQQLFDKEDFESAIDEYELLLNDSPDHLEYNYRIAVCFLNTNIDKSLAIQYLEKIVDHPKAEPKARYLLGRAYQFGYQFDKAISAFRHFLDKGEGDKKNIDDCLVQIAHCQNAKELMKFPIRVEFESLGKDVNSQFKDYFPFVPSDESFLAFNVRTDDGSELNPDGSYKSNVYVSKVKDGKYLAAQQVSLVNTYDGNEEIVGLTSNGDHAIIYKEDIKGEGKLFVCKVVNGSFMVLQELDRSVNSSSEEIAACINKDGTKLYFASDRPTGYGGTDLYVCQKLPNGKWGEAQNLGPSINSSDDEDFPNLSPDDKYLYFSSKGNMSMGGYDIFKAAWNNKKRKYVSPRNIGYPINTPEDNMNFRISSSGRYGYVSALRKGGEGDVDIYRVKFIDIPPRLTVIHGKIDGAPKDNQKDILITVIDDESGEVYGHYRPNRRTMKYVMILPPGEYDMSVEVGPEEILYERIKILDKVSFCSEIKKDISLVKNATK